MDDGSLQRAHDALPDEVRDRTGRDPVVSAAVINAQSVQAAATVARDSRGYDAGKKVNGRKRHIVVDTLGLLVVIAADVQERDGGKWALGRLRFRMPSVALVWADGGYAGRLVGWARQALHVAWRSSGISRASRTFEVLPRRWVVERTFAWVTRCRRLAWDYERSVAHSEAMVLWVMIGVTTRRLAHPRLATLATEMTSRKMAARHSRARVAPANQGHHRLGARS